MRVVVSDAPLQKFGEYVLLKNSALPSTYCPKVYILFNPFPADENGRINTMKKRQFISYVPGRAGSSTKINPESARARLLQGPCFLSATRRQLVGEGHY